MQDSIMSIFPQNCTDEITDLRSQLKELKNGGSDSIDDISQDVEVKEYLRVLNKMRKKDAGHKIY